MSADIDLIRAAADHAIAYAAGIDERHPDADGGCTRRARRVRRAASRGSDRSGRDDRPAAARRRAGHDGHNGPELLRLRERCDLSRRARRVVPGERVGPERRTARDVARLGGDPRRRSAMDPRRAPPAARERRRIRHRRDRCQRELPRRRPRCAARRTRLGCPTRRLVRRSGDPGRHRREGAQHAAQVTRSDRSRPRSRHRRAERRPGAAPSGAPPDRSCERAARARVRASRRGEHRRLRSVRPDRRLGRGAQRLAPRRRGVRALGTGRSDAGPPRSPDWIGRTRGRPTGTSG